MQSSREQVAFTCILHGLEEKLLAMEMLPLRTHKVYRKLNTNTSYALLFMFFPFGGCRGGGGGGVNIDLQMFFIVQKYSKNCYTYN